VAVGNKMSKALKGIGSGYWMALPALLAILAIVAYPLAFGWLAGAYLAGAVVPCHPHLETSLRSRRPER
jgi:hypothetical protein